MRRKQQQCGGEHSCAAWDQGSQPFALRTIAYLIVVLRTDYMRRRGNRAGAGAAWATAPELEGLTLKNKSFIQRTADLACVSKDLAEPLAVSATQGRNSVR